MTERDGYTPCPVCGELTDGDYCGLPSCEAVLRAGVCARCTARLAADDLAPYCLDCVLWILHQVTEEADA